MVRKTDAAAVLGGILAGTDLGQTPSAAVEAAAAAVAVYLAKVVIQCIEGELRKRFARTNRKPAALSRREKTPGRE